MRRHQKVINSIAAQAKQVIQIKPGIGVIGVVGFAILLTIYIFVASRFCIEINSLPESLNDTSVAVEIFAIDVLGKAATATTACIEFVGVILSAVLFLARTLDFSGFFILFYALVVEAIRCAKIFIYRLRNTIRRSYFPYIQRTAILSFLIWLVRVVLNSGVNRYYVI